MDITKETSGARMGPFKFLKKKKENNEVTKIKNSQISSNENKPAIYFDGLTSNDKIFNLLWFADGKYKNYYPDQYENIFFENELFKVTFSFDTEPSLLSGKLLIKPNSSVDPNESIDIIHHMSQ